MDLGQLVREKRFVTILEFVDELPEHCRTNSAMLNDPDRAAEMAERIVEREKVEREQGRGKVGWTPDVAEWSLMHELLSQIRDTLVRVNSEKPRAVKDFPRPRTVVAEELKKARSASTSDNAKDLVAQLTPWAAA